MAKTKLTLSIDRDVVKSAKTHSIKIDSNISTIVEEFLKSITGEWVHDLAKKLGVREHYTSYDDVLKDRPSGLKAEKIIRALRNGRKSIS